MINVSVSAFIMALFWSSIMILFFSFLLKSELMKQNIGLSFVLFFSLAAALRLITPFEFGYTITILSKKVLPFIQNILLFPVISLFHRTVCIYHLIFLIWIAGSLWKACLISTRYYHFQKFIRAARLSLPEETQPYVHILKKLHCSDRILSSCIFVRSRFITTPAVSGWIRPVILLPELEFTNQELEYIFMHELIHFKRHDILWQSMFGILNIIFWWNPFVKILKKRAGEAVELEIDRRIALPLSSYQKLEYLECIIKVQKHQMGFDGSSDFSIAFSSRNNSALLARSRYLIDSSQVKISRFFVVFGLLLIIFSTIFIVEPHSISPEAESESFTIDESANGYFIEQDKSSYDLYIDDIFIGNVTSIEDEAFKDFPVYQNKEDVPND